MFKTEKWTDSTTCAFPEYYSTGNMWHWAQHEHHITTNSLIANGLDHINVHDWPLKTQWNRSVCSSFKFGWHSVFHSPLQVIVDAESETQWSKFWSQLCYRMCAFAENHTGSKVHALFLKNENIKFFITRLWLDYFGPKKVAWPKTREHNMLNMLFSIESTRRARLYGLFMVPLKQWSMTYCMSW